ncbi:MAG: hypothetical protein [Olavius algarvensis Delta 4 endosymbiont]|nr:MAG: hypothetical protein [Olavius algarvensis Delta 4 endosymbiont]
MKTGQTYWEHAAQVLQQKPPDRLWRRHSDALDSLLLDRWLPRETAGLLLKTDMYDESLGAGITLPARASAWKTVGMDIAADMLFAARRVSGRHCLAATDIRHLAFAENSFEAIFSNSTLDHFGSVAQIVRSIDECYRILKPGGHFILTLDNPFNPVIALRQMLPYWLLVKLGITTFYYGKTLAPGRLRQLLVAAGFTVRHMEAILHCPRILAILASRIIDNRAPDNGKERFLSVLNRFEKLGRLPTRFISGYFIAVCCRK